MLYRKQRAKIGFAGSMTTILTRDKKRENRPRKVEDYQLQALLDEDDTNRKKCLPSNWMFLKQPFPCGRFKRHAMGKVQKIGK